MVIDVEPLPSDIESDEWLQDSHRIHEENRREMKHEIHVDGCIFKAGTVEQYMIDSRPELKGMVLSGIA